MTTLQVSIVNWNTRDALRRCLASLGPALQGVDARIVVVDNASSDGSADMVAAEFPAVRLIRSARNLGFAGGHNLAIDPAAFAHVLFLNPDVELSADAVRSMTSFLESTPRAAAVSPALTGHDGRVQNHLYRRWPTAAQVLLFWTVLRPLSRRVPGLGNILFEHAITGSSPIAVDQLPGAAMMVRSSALRSVGMLDPGYFIWWEDVDWSYRARAMGLTLHVLPDVPIRHAGGASFEPWSIEQRVFQFYRAFYRFLARHRLHGLARRVTPIVQLDLAVKRFALRLRPGSAAADTLTITKEEIRGIVRDMERGIVPFFESAEPGGGRPKEKGGPHAGDLPIAPESHEDAGDADRGEIDVIIVNWNGRRFLPRCIEAVQASSIPVRVIVVDNASSDGSPEYVRTAHPDVLLIETGRNAGYAAGANTGLAHTRAPYAFVMNPDVLIAPDHLESLRDRLESDPAIGAAQGKLYHMTAADFMAGERHGSVIDSAGHSILRSRMVVDRGQGCVDGPAWSREASIFSACGAALFLRRAMLEDIALDGEYFAESFFAYKEDVDLGWRARLLGWDVRYCPRATAHHVRALPLDRDSWRQMPLAARRHSWKNHYLLMLRNDRWPDVLRALPFILSWETLRLGHAVLRDPRVLPALGDALRCIRPALAARKRLAARRRTAPAQIRRWFGGGPIPVSASTPGRVAAAPADVSA